jgi:dihydrofolate reductase
LTLGKPVLMGRKTYLSIGKPLPGRTNIVVSRAPDLMIPGVLVAPTLESALAAARGDALRRGAGEIMVIGGSGIFVQIMALADRMEITHVHAQPDGDIYLPPIEAARWRLLARSDHPAGPRDEAAFSYVTYGRP